jgi:hypothetical protein
VCNLGRYFMPVAPLAVALVAVALHRVDGRRGALALAAILAAWSALFAWALWHDPHAANDSALLLAQSAYADGNQYIPNLKIARWADGAPGLWARIGLWAVMIGVASVWWRRSARAQEGATGTRAAIGSSPAAALAGTAALILAFAFTLEQWPAWRDSPSLARSLPLGAEGRAFAEGEVLVRPDEVIVGPGEASLLVRTPVESSSLPLTVGGEGVFRSDGLRPFVLRPTGARVDLPLRPYHVVRGRDGSEVFFARARLGVEGQAVLRPDSLAANAAP